MTSPNGNKIPLTPSQEVDTRYMSRIIEILTDKANENAYGWTKLGLLANIDEGANAVIMYNVVIWRDEPWDDWLPDFEIEMISRAIARWRQEADGVEKAPLWTSMFLGVTARGHARLSPGYGEDFGQWKIHTDRSNKPVVEKALEEM